MTFPSTFKNADHYIDECIKFFDEFKYLFCFPNTHVLVENVLDNINISDIEKIDVFDDEFLITSLVYKDDYMTNFLVKINKLLVTIPKMEVKEVEDNYKIDAPLSPKKRYEIVTMVKEVGAICEKSGCELLVDFGAGLGYLDQIIYEVTKYNVLGLESNQSHYDCAQKRQTKYHKNSTAKVKYIKHKVNEDSHLKIDEYIKQEFPKLKKFCIIGLHSCADLTVEAMHTFLKMPDARSLVIMPCCYHKMSHANGQFKYFPLSKSFKAAFEKTGAIMFMNVPFLRLAAHTNILRKDLYECAFDLLSRAVLQLYACENNFSIQRNKRRAVKIKDKTDFEAFLVEAATKGYKLIPKTDKKIKFPKKDQIIKKFNMSQIRKTWRTLCGDLTFRKTAFYILLQMCMQQVAENFVLLDRLLFLKENGVEDCHYMKIFAAEHSPRCMALIANKPCE